MRPIVALVLLLGISSACAAGERGVDEAALRCGVQ
jgi:hypothetical protein